MPRAPALPPNLPPRLICRQAAAEYLSVSLGTFDTMVIEGTMPAPKRLSDRRVAWDVRELDGAVDKLPASGGKARAPDEGWEDVDDAAQAASVR